LVRIIIGNILYKTLWPHFKCWYYFDPYTRACFAGVWL